MFKLHPTPPSVHSLIADPQADGRARYSRLAIVTVIYSAAGAVVHQFTSRGANEAIVRTKQFIRSFDRRHPTLKPHTSKTIIQPNS